MVLERLVGLALLRSVELVDMEIVGHVKGGDKGVVGFMERFWRGSGGLNEVESPKERGIACGARRLGEHRACAPLHMRRMVVKNLSAAKSVVRWHNGVVSG